MTKAKEINKNKQIINPSDIKFIFKIIRKNWYLPILFCFLAWAIAFVYVHKLVDIYGAKTQILLNTNETFQQKSVIGFDYGAYQEISNQMKVIKSTDIIKATLNKLDLDVSYFLVGRLKTSEVYRGTPFKVKVIHVSPNIYSRSIKIKIVSTDKYTLHYKSNESVVEIEGVFGKNLVSNDFNLLIEKTPNLNSITLESMKGLEYLFQIQNPNQLLSKYNNLLNVTNDEFTNILTLNIEDEISERAVTFLDTLCTVYIDYSLQSQISINENTVKYIDKQLDEIVYILDSIETQLERFKDKESILNLNKEEDSYYTKLDSYDGEINKYDLNIAALNDLEKYIIERKDPELLPPSIYVNSSDDFLKNAVNQLYNLQMERNNLFYAAKETNPAVEKIDLNIDKLRSNLLIYIGNSKSAFKEKIKGVSGKLGKYYTSLKSLPPKQRALLNITRKQQVNEKMYLFLLEKRANAIISRASIISDKKVIESPRSIGVVKPNKTKIYNLYLMIGLVVSLAIILIRTLFFSRIESYDELKAVTEFPIWGEILFTEKAKENYFIVEEDPKSPLTESFRTVRTNLDFISAKEKAKVVLVTSNSPGEGKTFCSVNLAAILAKAGKKVLILELDLHKPKVQIALGMKSEKGLSTILALNENVADCVMPSYVKNLDAILSGPIPPNPSDLILNKEMDAIFEYGNLNYDYVIVDTPPLGLISDSLVLMKYSDLVMFVLNPKMATKEVVRDVTELISNTSIHNFGFLLNGVKRKQSKYYYNKYAYGYGYGYGKSYGYGYGYRSKKK